MAKTYAELMNEVLACENQDEAKALVDREGIRLNKERGMAYAEAVSLTLGNIGYLAGYYDKETYHEILSLFDTSHPIFGTNYPSPEDAFEMGKKAGA